MAGHVYVSYDGHDVGYVRRLVDHLSDSWLTVWVDKEVGTGDYWGPDLEAPIRAASALLVVMSPASESSDRVRGEIMYAHSIGRPIIPLLLAGRPFFSQGGTAPENVIGGHMPDDGLLERLGDLSQVPVTHRRSGKPGRGSSSRERDPSLLAPRSDVGPAVRPGYSSDLDSDFDPFAPDPDLVPNRDPGFVPNGDPGFRPGFVPNRDPGFDRRDFDDRRFHDRDYGDRDYDDRDYDDRDFDDRDFDDDDRPRRFNPAVLLTVVGIIVLVVGAAAVALFTSPGPPGRPTTPVGASDPRTATPTTSPTLAAEAPLLNPATNPAVPTTTSKKPTTTTTTRTTTATTTTVTTTTTQPPPPVPGPLISPGSGSISINGTTTVTVTLDGTYPSDLTVTLTVSGALAGATGPVVISANSTGPASFTVTAGGTAGPGTVTARVSGGGSSSASIQVTDPAPPA